MAWSGDWPHRNRWGFLFAGVCRESLDVAEFFEAVDDGVCFVRGDLMSGRELVEGVGLAPPNPAPDSLVEEVDEDLEHAVNRGDEGGLFPASGKGVGDGG